MATSLYQNGQYTGPSAGASPELLAALQQLGQVEGQRPATQSPWGNSAYEGQLAKARQAVNALAQQGEAGLDQAPDGMHWGLDRSKGAYTLNRNNDSALTALAPIAGAALMGVALPAVLGGGAAAGGGGAAAAGGLAPAASLPGSVVGAGAGAAGAGAAAGGAAAAGAGAAKAGGGVLGGLLGSTGGKIAGAGIAALGLLDQRSQRKASENFLNAQLELRKRQLALAEQDYAGRAPMRQAGQDGLMKLAAAMQQGGGVFRNRAASEPAGYIGR